MIGSRCVPVAVVTALLLSGASIARAQGTDSRQGIASAQELSAAFRSVARDALPAIVSVKSRIQGQRMQLDSGELSPFDDEVFKRFFPDFGGMDQRRFGQIPPREGHGSGFVIDAGGIIMTNSHVVNGATRVIIQFQDGSELEAESWQTDPWSDVAIVRVKPEQPLPVIALGDSDRVEIGDWVLALGDPFGVGTSVTAGIISGKGRAPQINEREDFLQTDAAINPGNSGGPLVNLAGEVIGINTAISSRSGGYDGVGFAIPANLANWVGQQLIDNGEVERPYLGVMVQQLTADLRKQFGIGLNEGALVAQTVADGPAQQAGVRPGDIILDVGGRPVSNGIKLQGIVEQLQIGKSYPVQIMRDGERMTIDVTLAKMPEGSGRSRVNGSAKPDTRPESAVAEKLGIDVSELTDEYRHSLELDGAAAGVVVTAVDASGPAAEKGVVVGDLISQVGTTKVTSVAEFNAVLSQASGKSGVLLLLQNQRGTRFVVVSPTDSDSSEAGR